MQESGSEQMPPVPPEGYVPPPIPHPTQPSIPHPPQPPAPMTADTLGGGLIPYKNQPALISYYVGLFSLMPVIGFAMGIVAVILGIQGLKRAKEFPQYKGKAHAWFGIICGAFWALVYGVMIFGIAMAVYRA